MAKHLRLSLLFALASSAIGGEVRLIQEFPAGKHTLVEMLSAQRFVKVGTDWERTENGRPRMPRYDLFDFQERKIVQVPIPVHEMPKELGAVLGAHPSPTLIHHDGDVTSMLFKEFQNYKAVASYFCQFDHRTRRFSSLILLLRYDASRYLYELGFDAKDEYFYYAAATNPTGDALKDGYTSFELSRINLKTRAIDWSMTLPFPSRDKQLKLTQRIFSLDGKKLALVEYNDRGNQRDHPAVPPQQVYVIDVEQKTVDTYPVPLSTYGGTFSRDGQYLLLGSNELGELLRINLIAKKIDLKAAGPKLIHHFFLTPSGKSFLVVTNTALASPKAVQVRGVDDLKVRTSIPTRMLYPGSDSVQAAGVAPMDGRALLLPMVDAKGWPIGTGFRLYEVPADVDSPRVSGAAEQDVATAQAFILAAQYMETHKVLYLNGRQSDSKATFAPVAVSSNGDILVTGFRSDNSDGDYKPGRTRPVVARLDSTGKVRWERILTKKGFMDYEAGIIAATADGGCVASLRSYVHPGQAPVAHVVKLDASGKTVWDRDFRGGAGAGKYSPIADATALLPDGSISLTGRVSADPKAAPWRAVLDAKGKVLENSVGE